MRLFVGPLPGHADQQDVRDFIEDGLRPRGILAFLKKTSTRISCTMMEVPSLNGSGPIYFAAVHIHPSTLAEQAVATLNGGIIRGTPVTVRELIERDPANDRRRQGSDEQPSNRRARDRRGHAILRICRAAQQVTVAAVKGFQREYRD